MSFSVYLLPRRRCLVLRRPQGDHLEGGVKSHQKRQRSEAAAGGTESGLPCSSCSFLLFIRFLQQSFRHSMSVAGEYQVMTLKQLKYFCNNHKKWRLCPKICVGRAFSDFSAADFGTFCLVWTLGSHALSLMFSLCLRNIAITQKSYKSDVRCPRSSNPYGGWGKRLGFVKPIIHSVLVKKDKQTLGC